jgi:CO dehydrogenase maturation factor
MCRANSTVRGVLTAIPSHDGEVIIDLEASPEHLTRGTIRHMDRLLLVGEPYFETLETVRRYHALAEDLGNPEVSVVGNKVRGEDGSAVADYCAEHGCGPNGAGPRAHHPPSPLIRSPSA